MKILIAEDDTFFCKLLQQVLASDHDLVVARDGNEAWAELQRPDAPRLAILDWVMPGLSGPEVCRRVRSSASLSSMYLILFTAKNSTADIVSGLRAGADDYITKPPVPAELRARVRLGRRILVLQDAVNVQSEIAKVACEREHRLRESFDGCRLCRALPGNEDLRGDGVYLDQHFDPADCGSSTCVQIGRSMDLPSSCSPENSHS